MLAFLISVKAVRVQTKQSKMSGTGFAPESKRKGNTELASKKHMTAVTARKM